MRSRTLTALVLAIAMLLSVLLAGEAFAQRAAGRQWRWDLIQIGVGMTALAGGTDTSRDAATGETISLTGSGQFRPSARTASGGGTFVHKRADGTEVAHGVYIVSSFRNFRLGGGTPPPVTDGILTPRLGTPPRTRGIRRGHPARHRQPPLPPGRGTGLHGVPRAALTAGSRRRVAATAFARRADAGARFAATAPPPRGPAASADPRWLRGAPGAGRPRRGLRGALLVSRRSQRNMDRRLPRRRAEVGAASDLPCGAPELDARGLR